MGIERTQTQKNKSSLGDPQQENRQHKQGTENVCHQNKRLCFSAVTKILEGVTFIRMVSVSCLSVTPP